MEEENKKCFEVIKKKLPSIISEIKYNNCSFKFQPRNQTEGFLGQYYGLEISIESAKSEKREVLNFFVKLPPIDKSQNDFVEEGGCFKIELGLYTKIFSKLLSSQEEQCIPKCFLGFENCIVLEDMVNYKILNKLDFIPYEHCVVVIQCLARFHARSIIFEKKNKVKLIDWCKTQDIFINLNEQSMFQSTLDYFAKNLVILVDVLPEIDDEEKRRKYKTLISEIASNHYKKTAPVMNETNVLVHADLWTNNILFKYNQHDKVEQCCFIDFQMARYSTPAYDLMYFIYSSTSRNFRQEKLDYLLKIYYDSILESLLEANLSEESFFTWDDFMKSIAKIKLNSLIQALATMSVTLMNEKATVLRTKQLEPLSKILLSEYQNNKKYNFRIKDSLLDLCSKLDDFINN